MIQPTDENSFIAVRVKTKLRERIFAIAEKHEVSASVIMREALKLGLKRFDREAFRWPEADAR